MTQKPDTSAIEHALGVLGLDRDAAWSDIRARYRELMRHAHPDVAADTGSANVRATAINLALSVLRTATDNGAVELTGPVTSPTEPSGSHEPRARGALLLRGEADVFVLLLEGASTLGEVVHADPVDGTIQVLLGPTRPPSNLLIELEPTAEGTAVAFTLESPDAGSAPPLDALVGALARGLGGVLEFGRRSTQEHPGEH